MPPPVVVSEVVPPEARDDEAVTWGEMRALESRLLRRLLAETGARVQGLIEDQVAEDLDIYDAHGAAVRGRARVRAGARCPHVLRTQQPHALAVCPWVASAQRGWYRASIHTHSRTHTHDSDGDDGGARQKP